jgi:hypothetical protein
MLVRQTMGTNGEPKACKEEGRGIRSSKRAESEGFEVQRGRAEGLKEQEAEGLKGRPRAR